MSTTEVNDFLASSSGSKHPGFAFTAIGDTCKGVISEEPRIIDVPVLGKQGETAKKMVIAVTNDAGETMALWVKRGQMAQAIQEAITAAGAPGLEVGGKIAVRFAEERDTGKPSKLKVFVAQYQAPNPVPAATDMSDLL